jgi:hypothetical protein
MRKRHYILAITTLIVTFLITACESSSKKVEDAQKKVEQTKVNAIAANIELNQARKDSISNYKQFKKESEDRIIAQEKSIAEFKARIAKEKKANRAEYEKKLVQLEQKNSDLRKKLNEYKDEGKGKWISFKIEFNHDMDELGKAFKDLTVTNVK